MPTAAPARALTRALAGAIACALLAAPTVAQGADPVTAVLDRTNAEPVKVPPERKHAQAELRRSLGAAALLEIDPVTGTPQVLARLDGFLTPPSSRDPEAIALTYVRDHANVFGLDAGDVSGLRLTSRRRAPDGTSFLSWEQRAGGLANIDGGLHAAISANGRLVNLRGGVVPDVDRDVPAPTAGAGSAYSAAVPGGTPPPASTTKRDAARTTSFADGSSASLVRYQSGGASRIGWRLLVPAGSNALYDAIVDARTGVLQRRINRVRFASQINHFDVNPRAEDGTPTVSDVPAHWLDGGTDLSGPYVHAVSDLDDSIQLADKEPPFSLTQEPSPADAVQSTSPSGEEPQWVFAPVLGPDGEFCEPLCSWRAGNRTANRRFSTAQLFWYLNTFRDHLARPPIGFTSASGGFEVTDPVLAQSLDGASTGPASQPDQDHRNNASMVTLPDGYRGLMQVHLFAFGPRRDDGTHDASLVYHEYTHGLVDRLVTDAQGNASMFGAQSGALAEGISDFYALDFLAQSQPALVPDTVAPGEVHLGQWLQEDPETTGLDDTLRTEGVDCAVGDPDAGATCPGTATSGPGGYDYRDFGRVFSGPETHSDGEIWAQTLWSIRGAIAPGHTPAELARVRRYLTDGLRLAPENPTFLDMRNAILQAAVNAGAGQDWTTLWKVFASRGMGWSASTNGVGDVTPTAAFDMPPTTVSKPPAPPTAPAPAAPVSPSTPPPVARSTALVGTKLKANRKGLFKVQVLFGDTAPLGSARLTVSRKGKRLARASTPVRLGRTVTKTLQLTKKGRRVIKRGRTKRVTLELRLPDGHKLKKTVTLTRRR